MLTFLLPNYIFLCIKKSKVLLNHIESSSLSPSEKNLCGLFNISLWFALLFLDVYLIDPLSSCKKSMIHSMIWQILAFKSLKKVIPMAYLYDTRKFFKSFSDIYLNTYLLTCAYYTGKWRPWTTEISCTANLFAVRYTNFTYAVFPFTVFLHLQTRIRICKKFKTFI